MQRIIKQREIIDDHWLLLNKDTGPEDVPDRGDVIIPLRLWIEQKHILRARDGGLAIWFDSDEEPEMIEPHELQRFPLIAINFPVFTDGRGFTIARLLRERYTFRGEIRAIGEVLRDQLFFMRRCGFDAYAVSADKSAEDALRGLDDFSDSYQPAADQPLPLFRRRRSR